MTIDDTYFGWNALAHTPDCTTPGPASWEVQTRLDEGVHPLSHREDLQHSCPNLNCSHDNGFPRVTVRLVCRSCHTVHLISGENPTQDHTTTAAHGYGEPPARMAGLYLYPGRAFLYGEGPGTSGWDDQPLQWLVTRDLPADGLLVREDCVGRISRWTTAAHQQRWRADAVQTPLPGRLTAAEHGMAFARRESDFTSIDEAAAFIAAALTHNTVEVHV
ncbi:hypothetical protein [Streptomyces sp. DSM 40484]|uniref:hypothetical protein n=1 Tax=Streptomyces kroppenstedtii TaxID=3051181 RepID=UPI0028D12298|nr:hypothetical protein [Streptomyces sp. DSM 40484]